MTEEGYEFGVSVFIRGKHVVTARGNADHILEAEAKSYKLGAETVKLVSEIIAMNTEWITQDDLVEGYCLMAVGEYAKQMRKASWYQGDALYLEHMDII